jgi:hypothetical protein
MSGDGWARHPGLQLPVARGISGTVLRTRIAVARLHSRVPIPTHADGTSAPALRRRVASVRLTPWVPFAVEAHEDVQRIGSAQAAGASPAIGTKYALQALTAERPSRNRQVDRATRSWGTNPGSLTQRDRDPPFKRSDAGAIPARPTNLPVTHRKRCIRLVSGRGEVQVLSRAPIEESEAGRACTRLLTGGCCQNGMAFEWSALRQPRGSHVACLVGLNPTMTREGRERSTRSASAKTLEGEVRGRAPSFRKRVASSRMCGSRPTAFRHLAA